jgi:hypothetical protein
MMMWNDLQSPLSALYSASKSIQIWQSGGNVDVVGFQQMNSLFSVIRNNVSIIRVCSSNILTDMCVMELRWRLELHAPAVAIRYVMDRRAVCCCLLTMIRSNLWWMSSNWLLLQFLDHDL